MITIIQESLITFRRNTDHDHPGIAITIVRESLITIPRNPHNSYDTGMTLQIVVSGAFRVTFV